MKRSRTSRTGRLLLPGMAGLLACVSAAATTGGSSVTVQLLPAAAQVKPGGTVPFTATVSGTTNQSVTWALAEAGGGTIDSAGHYSAPATSGTFHVTAKSSADTSAEGTATVTVTQTPVVGVSISPQAAALATGGAQSFAAIVTGASDTSVTWKVQEGSAGGYVASSGSYTAPVTAGTYHVVVTSHADPTKTDIATVTVSAPGVLLFPVKARVLTGLTAQFRAKPVGVSGGITWSVQEGAAGGTVTQSGLYTAPGAAGTYHVIATSTADGSKTATATVTVIDAASLQTGVWQDVTRNGVTLNSADYGAQDVLTDPALPNEIYGFGNGVWKSIDYGETWFKPSPPGPLDQGRPWGEAIDKNPARDPFTPPILYACQGYGSVQGAFKSVDGGLSWLNYRMGPNGSDNDVYNFDPDPADVNHVIAGMHWNGNNHIKESHDGGRTWTDLGPVADGANSASDGLYVFFLGADSKTWLAVSQSPSSGGTFRTTNGGATWSKVGDFQHFHGNAQVFVDAGGVIYLPHTQGIHRSTDYGATWTSVSTTPASAVVATEKFLYASSGLASQGSWPADLQRAPRSTGSPWSKTYAATPAGMTNGSKRMTTVYDPSIGKWVVISANWLAGFWRYIEP